MVYIGVIMVDLVYFIFWKNDKYLLKILEINYLDRFIYFKNIGFFKRF